MSWMDGRYDNAHSKFWLKAQDLLRIASFGRKVLHSTSLATAYGPPIKLNVGLNTVRMTTRIRSNNSVCEPSCLAEEAVITML